MADTIIIQLINTKLFPYRLSGGMANISQENLGPQKSMVSPAACPPQNRHMVPKDHLLLILGDFNLRVRCSCPDSGDHWWTGVRGNYGVGKMNKNGVILLPFCALNCLSIMNTCFEKHNV